MATVTFQPVLHPNEARDCGPASASQNLPKWYAIYVKTMSSKFVYVNFYEMNKLRS